MIARRDKGETGFSPPAACVSWAAAPSASASFEAPEHVSVGGGVAVTGRRRRGRCTATPASVQVRLHPSPLSTVLDGGEPSVNTLPPPTPPQHARTCWSCFWGSEWVWSVTPRPLEGATEEETLLFGKCFCGTFARKLTPPPPNLALGLRPTATLHPSFSMATLSDPPAPWGDRRWGGGWGGGTNSPHECVFLLLLVLPLRLSSLPCFPASLLTSSSLFSSLSSAFLLSCPPPPPPPPLRLACSCKWLLANGLSEEKTDLNEEWRQKGGTKRR